MLLTPQMLTNGYISVFRGSISANTSLHCYENVDMGLTFPMSTLVRMHMCNGDHTEANPDCLDSLDGSDMSMLPLYFTLARLDWSWIATRMSLLLPCLVLMQLCQLLVHV